MAVGQPTPLTEPLPGGKQDATVKLHPIVTATMRSPREFMANPGGKFRMYRSMLGSRENWVDLPIPAFLIEHPSVGPIIVDTGFHPSVATDPKQNLGPLLGRLYDIRMEPDQALPAQLRKRGVEPSDVGIAIMTHLHMDHASAVSEFTSPTYVLGEGEWDAFNKYGTRHGYIHSQVAHAIEMREVSYSGPSASSYATFGRSFDLFGDGSVRLVHTPGHTLGHQSLIVRLPDREALITGDAAYFLTTLDDELRGYTMAPKGEHMWRRSLREIQLYRRENPNALIIPGHDPETWTKLEPSYG